MTIEHDARILAHQDAGGPLAVFVDGRYLRAATAADEHARDRQALAPGGSVEILKTCAVHPRVAAVDCTACVPLEAR